MLKKIGGVLVAVLPVAFMSAPAHAAMDLTAATASFGEVSVAVPIIGGLFLGALGLMAAWKLARGLFA